jgi:hypothetical protein
VQTVNYNSGMVQYEHLCAGKQGLVHPLVRPEPACGISDRVSRRAGCVESIRNTGSAPQDKDRHRASFLSSFPRGLEFLKLCFPGKASKRPANRTWSLFKLVISDSRICGRCYMETETASHSL